MSSQNDTIQTLGRPFDLGMLYDRRSEKLVLGKTLWSPNHLSQAVNTIARPYTHSEVLAEDTIDDKLNALNIKASLKLSFLGGLVSVQGAAKYLDDRKESTKHSRVVLKYETTTELKQLTMEHLAQGKMQYPEVLDHDIATHVVVGILYGANAFLIFDQEVSEDESLRDVHGNMEVLVKALRNIRVDGDGNVDIKEDQKKKTEKIYCKMYGDFRTEESPTTYEEAVRIYKQLPLLIGDKGQNAVAVQVYLYPLSEINSKGQRMVREISANYISKTCEIQEHIQCIEAQCSNLMREDVCSLFPRVKKQLSLFKSNISRYKTFFQNKLLPLLPSIRGGGAEESTLGDIFEEKERSPFAQTCMDAWIEEKRKEIKKLQGMVSFLGSTPFVNPEDVENEAFDPRNEKIVCCTFTIGEENDHQILSMDGYLTGKVLPQLNREASTGIDDKNFNKRMRQTLKQFAELKAANENHKEVKFFATEKSLSDTFSGNPGALIYLYEDGALDNEDFKSSPRPEKLEAENVRDVSIELRWIDPHFSKNKIKRYKIQYKKDEDASLDWITEYSVCGNRAKQTATISGLDPATRYLFRVCAVRQIVVSQYSDTLSETTKPTSPPGKLPFEAATPDAITIGFANPKTIGEGDKIEKYEVKLSANSQHMVQVLQCTEDAPLTCAIEGLQAGVRYEFRVTAMGCREGDRDSVQSDRTDPLQTTLPPKRIDTRRILTHCKLVQSPEDGTPAVHILPLTLAYQDSRCQLQKYVITLAEKKTQMPGKCASVPEKVLMVIGSTGSGKITTVNAMINYVLGVQWNDDFRLKMIDERSSNQAHSVTKIASCYTLSYMEGFKVPYNLTIVDTHGFGDTRGIEHDKVLTEQIRRIFNTKGPAGIDHVDAICFMVQAGNPWFTETQTYVFGRILAMFGKDIKKNILVLFTFADSQKPHGHALSAMLEAGFLEDENNFFKFNNCALFVANSGEDDEDNFDRMFWKIGMASFEKFFQRLGEMEPQSLPHQADVKRKSFAGSSTLK
ncbi:neoverrucotoxin subunit alpha-like [Acropora muricata]|uniref:neoverrucotoxin subunit alpha-like n=1 Tax=Acropora muricata TaxID=159855 RepID=UPI0034E59F88